MVKGQGNASQSGASSSGVGRGTVPVKLGQVSPVSRRRKTPGFFRSASWESCSNSLPSDVLQVIVAEGGEFRRGAGGDCGSITGDIMLPLWGLVKSLERGKFLSECLQFPCWQVTQQR